MKVCFFTYPSAFQNIGGGEIQLLKTKEYLEKEGVSIDFFDPWKTKIENYDILHVFSSVKDCLGLIDVARSRNVKVVTSPVLWSDWRRALHTDGGIRQKADLLLRHSLKWCMPAFPSSRRKVLQHSDMLLPNSLMEKKQISRLFAIKPSKIEVVYNGVEERFLNASPAAFQEKYGKFPFVLSVGRIEPRKNQLNLIEAMHPMAGVHLVLIGNPVSGYEKYFEACKKAASTRILFIDAMSHEDKMLASAYAACEVFALQGWFETPGLVALEAGLAGARVVATVGGSTKEYFKDYAGYLDPSNPVQIRRQIELALGKSKNVNLQNHVLANFTWKRSAHSTLDCYKKLLSRKS